MNLSCHWCYLAVWCTIHATFRLDRATAAKMVYVSTLTSLTMLMEFPVSDGKGNTGSENCHFVSHGVSSCENNWQEPTQLVNIRMLPLRSVIQIVFVVCKCKIACAWCENIARKSQTQSSLKPAPWHSLTSYLRRSCGKIETNASTNFPWCQHQFGLQGRL